MCSDELFGGDAVEGLVSISLARIDISTEPHFEMQVCQIGTFSRPHRSNGVSTLYILTDLRSDRV